MRPAALNQSLQLLPFAAAANDDPASSSSSKGAREGGEVDLSSAKSEPRDASAPLATSDY